MGKDISHQSRQTTKKISFLHYMCIMQITQKTRECSCITLLIGIQWKNIMGNSKTMKKFQLKKRQVMLWSILEQKWVIQLLVRTEFVLVPV